MAGIFVNCRCEVSQRHIAYEKSETIPNFPDFRKFTVGLFSGELYIDSEIFKDSNDIWYMIMHWEKRADLKQASKAMMISDKTLAFRECLNPQKIKIKIYDQLQSWNLEK